MKGINRKLDKLGRITIPSEYRKELGIKEHSTLSMLVDSNRIILEKGYEVDKLGRIEIPINIREVLRIKEKEELNIEIEDDKIFLNKKK